VKKILPKKDQSFFWGANGEKKFPTHKEKIAQVFGGIFFILYLFCCFLGKIFYILNKYQYIEIEINFHK
jgi:hypothetical protein